MIIDKLMNAFGDIILPEFGENIVALNCVRNIRILENNIEIDLVLPTFALKSESKCVVSLRKKIEKLLGSKVKIVVNVFAEVLPAIKQSINKPGISNIKNIIPIISGKGGVGKSTVAANLALALSFLGCRVGLLDSDIYGPSIPTLFNIPTDTQILGLDDSHKSEKFILPVKSKNIKLMSVGFLVDTDSAMIWRGPMITSVSMQMFFNVAWGELDYLIIDMPPGTGDIQLTIMQKINIAGAIIVATPERLAIADALRAKSMLDKMNIPILGLVENMSYIICSACKKKQQLFPKRSTHDELNIDCLVRLPFDYKLKPNDDRYLTLAHTVATRIARISWAKVKLS